MDATPSDNVYMTGLPHPADSEMISQVFSQYGTVVQVKVLPNTHPAPKDSAALIRFSSVDEAVAVVENLNEQIPAGLVMPIKCRYATQGGGKGGGKGKGDKGGGGKGGGFNSWQQDGGGGGGAPYGGGGGGGDGGDNLYVKGLPVSATQESIMQDFSSLGTVTSIRVLEPPAGSQSKAALIRFASAAEAQHVKESLHGLQPEGFPEPLTIRFANDKGGGKGGDKGGGGGGGGKGGGGGGFDAGGGPFDGETLIKMICESGMLPGGAKYQNPEASLYVAGLPGGTTNEHLYRLFAAYGAISSTWTKQGGEGDRAWSIGFVNYFEPAAAMNAIQVYHGMQLPNGLSLKVVMKSGGKGGQ